MFAARGVRAAHQQRCLGGATSRRASRAYQFAQGALHGVWIQAGDGRVRGLHADDGPGLRELSDERRKYRHLQTRPPPLRLTIAIRLG